SPEEKDEKGNPCRPFWKNPADEMRFLRFMGLAYDCANARAPYESPRLAAVQPSDQQALEDDDDDGIDPREKLKDIVRRYLEAKEAARIENATDVTPAPEAHTEAETVATPPEPDDGIDGELA